MIVKREPDAARLGVGHLLSLQREEGCWEGEMVWCTMILSQQVIVRHVTGRPYSADERRRIVKHYELTRTAAGVWGLHPESEGYVFFTALAYVALRLLGLDRDHPLTATARLWLRSRPGGVLAIPNWGKYWLAFLGLYDWEAVNPCQPELYLLPGWLPFHPARLYCHTRNIYLGLSYLYGTRFTASLDVELRDALRRELYDREYSRIDFHAHRYDLAETDAYVRPGAGVRAAFDVLRVVERVIPDAVRRRAAGHCLDRIRYEQRTSNFQGLSPVNALLDCLAIHAADPAHPDLQNSLDGLEAWRWDDDEEGLRYCGARSNTWDTALAMQAVLANPAAARASASQLRASYRYLDGAQIRDELPDAARERRDPVRGGWCFSDGAHRWAVSDCTAEALCAILEAHDVAGLIPAADRIADARLVEAARFILSRQNDDGGFGTYERRRGGSWLENINPTEMFGSCMTERSYIECTASSVAALAGLRRALPGPALARHGIAEASAAAIDRGLRFLKHSQNPDGSFPGFWGIQFTYAAFHVAKALAATGSPAADASLRRLARFLEATQKSDGGWGEHYSGCLDNRYAEHPDSQPVMTSWAVLALLFIDGLTTPARRGLAFLERAQQRDGSWPDGAVNGVFFGSAMLDYRLYRSYFPVWAQNLASAQHFKER